MTQSPIERPWDKPKPSPEKPSSSRRGTWLPLGIMVGVVGMIAISFASCDTGSQRNGNRISDVPDAGNDYGALVVCQDRVSEQLRAPATADFASVAESSISQSGSKWTIRSYVDAQNGFGAQIRTSWTCTATHVSGDRYTVTATLE
jgi:hypothetical protein